MLSWALTQSPRSLFSVKSLIPRHACFKQPNAIVDFLRAVTACAPLLAASAPVTDSPARHRGHIHCTRGVPGEHSDGSLLGVALMKSRENKAKLWSLLPPKPGSLKSRSTDPFPTHTGRTAGRAGAGRLLTRRGHGDDRLRGGVVVVLLQGALAAAVPLHVVLVDQLPQRRGPGQELPDGLLADVGRRFQAELAEDLDLDGLDPGRLGVLPPGAGVAGPLSLHIACRLAALVQVHGAGDDQHEQVNGHVDLQFLHDLGIRAVFSCSLLPPSLLSNAKQRVVPGQSETPVATLGNLARCLPSGFLYSDLDETSVVGACDWLLLHNESRCQRLNPVCHKPPGSVLLQARASWCI